MRGRRSQTKRRLHPTPYELMQQERYTPEEAAELMEIGIDVLRQATVADELRAQIIGHDIIGIRRVDVLAWLESSDGRARADRAHTGL